MAAAASYNYMINSQLPPDMGRRIQRLNARVERRFLPKEKLTLSLTVNDIFNSRQDVMRVLHLLMWRTGPVIPQAVSFS